MIATVLTVSLCGVEAHTVRVEADVTSGLPHTQIVGLPDTSVRESKERVQSAIRNSGYEFPRDRVTLNLAPAELPKEGSGFDLPIALALLAASGQADAKSLTGLVFVGELGLDGSVRPVRGVLVAALAARDRAKGIVVPGANREEALAVEGLRVAAPATLREAVGGARSLSSFAVGRACPPGNPLGEGLDLAEVKGQENARRALEIAAAGGHNLLLIGPPGTGKTMLARRLPTILPGLTESESLDATMIHSVAGTLGARGLPLTTPPFRAPHHTVSDVGLVGGGNPPRPGEVSLAHRGVLFLDELPEFRRSALESLRQPLEDGGVVVVRAGRRAAFPSRFQLVASMNPCACGNAGGGKPCTCSSTDVRKYRGRVSGPLLDRIDLHVWVGPVDVDRITGDEAAEASPAVRTRVEAARKVQRERIVAAGGATRNADLEGRPLRRVCALPPGGRQLLAAALRRRGLSPRAIHRVLRVARTIADLEGSAGVKLAHLAEAARFRILTDGFGGERIVAARREGVPFS